MSPQDANHMIPASAIELAHEIGAALLVAETLLTEAGHWRNEAGYLTDAALWIGKASTSARQQVEHFKSLAGEGVRDALAETARQVADTVRKTAAKPVALDHAFVADLLERLATALSSPAPQPKQGCGVVDLAVIADALNTICLTAQSSSQHEPQQGLEYIFAVASQVHADLLNASPSIVGSGGEDV